MAHRFRRRHSHTTGRSAEPDGMPPGRRRRIIRTMFWSGAALLLLFVVLGYDRSETRQAQELIEQAQQFEKRALYDDAVRYYQRAFDNPRLSRLRKAQIALAVGDIQFERFRDYSAAHAWYQRALRMSAQAVEKHGSKQRLREAEQMAVGGGEGRRRGTGADVTTSTAITPVELVSPPVSDQSGPVVARYKGGALRAGELARALRDLPPGTEVALRNDPARLEQFVREQLQRSLTYQAALDAGLHRDPTVQARLYDYQRTLLADRYVAGLRERANSITTPMVEEYYRANESRYRQPARVALAMIKTDSEESAAAARAELLAGRSFTDVATSHSIDQPSAAAGGVVGYVSDTDTSIPGVGVAPKLIKELVSLPADAVTSATRINDAWFIFKILSTVPPRVTTLDEARPQIEFQLRAQRGQDVIRNLPGNLMKQYQAEINTEELKRIWEYRDSDGVMVTTGTVSVTTAPLSGNGALPDSAPSGGNQ